MSRPGHGTGFTLVEIVIVVAVVAILLSMATPAYLRQGLRAHRTEAIARMLETAACQERIRAVQGQYDPAHCLPSSTTRYEYAWAGAVSNGFTVRAIPQGGQVHDECGALSLSHDGTQTANGTQSVTRCWSGR